MHQTEERPDAACVGRCCSEESHSVWVVFCESRGHTTQSMLHILDAFLFFWAALQSEQRAAVAAAWGETVCAASTAQNNTTCCAVMQQWQAANKPGVHQVSSYRQLLWLAGRYFILRSPDTRWRLNVALLLLQTGGLLLLLMLFLFSEECLQLLLQVSSFFFFLACRYQSVSSAHLTACTRRTKPQVKCYRDLVWGKSVAWLDGCRQVWRSLRKHQEHPSQTVNTFCWRLQQFQILKTL